MGAEVAPLHVDLPDLAVHPEGGALRRQERNCVFTLVFAGCNARAVYQMRPELWESLRKVGKLEDSAGYVKQDGGGELQRRERREVLAGGDDSGGGGL